MTVGTEPRRKKGWMNLRVTRTQNETPDTKTFFMVDAEDGNVPFDYVAGQYLTFRFDDLGGKPLVRSYTMSSSPCQTDAIGLTVKRVDGGIVSNWLCDNVAIGTILRARGPIGKFCWDPAKGRRHLVMVAAGSGVTPFVSMLREYAPHLGQPGFPNTMALLVAYRSDEDIICRQELEEAAKQAGIRVQITLTRTGPNTSSSRYWSGRPDQAMLDRFIEGRFKDTLFMTCGPQGLMETVAHYLRQHGVPEEFIEQESFA